MGYLAKRFPNEPVIILWSDHIVKHIEKFKNIIVQSSKIIEENPNKIIFIGQKPRFPSEKPGWIETHAEALTQD